MKPLLFSGFRLGDKTPDSGQHSAQAGVFDYLASTISELPISSIASCVFSAA